MLSHGVFFWVLFYRSMQGRVLMISMSLAAATGPVGFVLAGPLSDFFGLQVWFVGAGMVLGLLSLISSFVPAVMRIVEGPAIDQNLG
jgi:hypothetical protein